MDIAEKERNTLSAEVEENSDTDDSGLHIVLPIEKAKDPFLSGANLKRKSDDIDDDYEETHKLHNGKKEIKSVSDDDEDDGE